MHWLNSQSAFGSREDQRICEYENKSEWSLHQHKKSYIISELSPGWSTAFLVFAPLQIRSLSWELRIYSKINFTWKFMRKIICSTAQLLNVEMWRWQKVLCNVSIWSWVITTFRFQWIGLCIQKNSQICILARTVLWN